MNSLHIRHLEHYDDLNIHCEEHRGGFVCPREAAVFAYDDKGRIRYLCESHLRDWREQLEQEEESERE